MSSGRPCPFGEAGFREQLLSLVGIVFRIVGDFGVAELDRRDMGLGIGAGDAENIEDLLAVDRVTGGEADARIVKRLLRAAKEQILVLDRDRLVDVEAGILRDRVDLLGLQTFDDVGFAVEKRQRPRRGVADEVIVDAWNFRRAEEELGIGGQDRGVALLFDIFVGTGAVHPRRQLGFVRHVLGRHDRQEGRKVIVERRRVAMAFVLI